MKLFAAVLLTALTAAGQHTFTSLTEGQRIERIDVPPIENKAVTYIKYRGVDMQRVEVHPLTCADKTRFLMTAEDGSKHCILLRNSDNDVYVSPATSNAPQTNIAPKP